ncbi:kinase-like domain-containing protein [Aspergillus carlsbadensis]|nr:kinase-like domain-containing protein [Aspergillus carlsbadensis]
MPHPPDSILEFYTRQESQHPDATFSDYLAELMAHPSSAVVFTPSLRDSNRPIVTIAQIRSATDLTPRRKDHSKILQISASTVLKVGWRVSMREAEALMLVAARTAVPVPEVFSAYMIGDVGFILMRKVEGELLSACMESMARDELRVIAEQLKAHVREWRTLGSTFLGSVEGGPCPDILFNHPWDYKPEGIWYEKEEALKEKKLSSTGRTLFTLGVLTHGDLHCGNIIIRHGSIAGIVDWGEAGYSLPEREFFAAKRIALDGSWVEMINHAVPFLAEEYELMDEIDRSMMRYSPV